MPDVTAEKLIEVASTTSEQIFDQAGEVLAMVHWVNERGEHQVVRTPWSNNYEKQIAIGFVRELMKQDGAVACVLICEAWTVMLEAGEVAEAGTASNHPDRREVLILMGEDSRGLCQGSRDIIRSPLTGKAYLGPLVVTRPEHLEGGLVGLLPRGKLQ